MKSFTRWLFEETLNGGAKAGSLEIHSTSISSAVDYARYKLGDDKFSEIPDLASNYKFAKKQAGKGWTKRKDMPVITSRDVHEFKNRLQQGFIDIHPPHAPETDPSNPFPTGLSGSEAKAWLERGLKKHDGESGDDRIKIETKMIPVGKLKPIQGQIYVDKAVDAIARAPLSQTKNFLSTQTLYITSSDNYIIDGHHRYLAGMLIDPKMKVQVLSIDLPIKTLLPMALAYGDAIGNYRNK